jgi:hypothetical protein
MRGAANHEKSYPHAGATGRLPLQRRPYFLKSQITYQRHIIVITGSLG